MKLIDLLEEDEFTRFKMKTTVDPETGRSSSKVEYTPLRHLDRQLEDANEYFKKAIRQHRDDKKLVELHDMFSKVKRAIRTHLNKEYR